MGTVEWIVLAVISFFAGGGLGFGLSRIGRKQEATRLSEVESELEAYKSRVNEHFAEAATHFQAIGEQYRALYVHMAEGSEKLCQPGSTQDALRFPRPDELTPEPEASVEQKDDPEDTVTADGDEIAAQPMDAVAEKEESATSVDGDDAMQPGVEEDGKPRLYH